MNAPLHICVAGPIAGDHVKDLLDVGARPPAGYAGAPLTAVLISELLGRGNRVTGLTTDSRLALAGGPVRLRGPNFELVVVPQRTHAWRFNGRRPGRALDLFALERRALAQEIRRSVPDIVHAHWSYEFALAALDVTMPHLITCHDSPAAVWHHTHSPYRLLRWLMAREVFRRGRCFTTVSQYMADELSTALARPPMVIPNPVARLAFMLGHERPAGTTRRVAMVCNGWSSLKNPQPALQAFAMFRKREPRAEMHLFGIGFGPGEEAQQWANARGLVSGLHFHGSMPHRRLLEALAGMDALLHPSLEESFGVVVAEAMTLGLPVVGGKASGALPNLLGGSSDLCATGELVDVLSPDEIATALAKVFDEHYVQRSRAAYARARTLFAPDAIADRYIDAYRTVIDQAVVPAGHDAHLLTT